MSAPPLFARGPETLFGVGVVTQPSPASDLIRGSQPTILEGPDGRPAVGSLGVLADNVLGYSLIASLPEGSWTVSTEIWIDVVAPLPTRQTGVLAEGRTVQRGSYATGSVTDNDGDLLALIRERGRLVDTPVTALARDVPAAPARIGTDVMDRLGLLPKDDDTLIVEVDEELENPRRALHGGVSLCAAEVAASWSRVQANPDLATSSLHVVHNRPIPSGCVVEFRATTRHAGRRLWVTDVTGLVEGRAAVIARVTAEPPIL
ncbi:PaaI family thioesterase [Nocardioides sp. YJ-D4]